MKFLSLRWKISGILIISNIILGVLLVVGINRTVSEHLGEQLIARGKAIAVNLSKYAAEPLIAGDRIGLRQLISDNLNFQNIQYILIYDAEGTVLADNYNGQIPAELKFTDKPDDINEEERLRLIHLKESNVSCYDIWQPVEEGYLGMVRVGIREDFVMQTISRTNWMIILTVLSVTLIGIIIVLVLANRIIKPIVYLTSKAGDISQGKLDETINLKTNDEIERLAEALERLRESVKIALDRLKKDQKMRM
ncbi:MAG: HAMP domain-containing protein [Caldithrix sp.]|nr:HAMP domain-containing protein [Caldithrix sp.]